MNTVADNIQNPEIRNHPLFNLEEFASRWKRARIAAIQNVMEQPLDSTEGLVGEDGLDAEEMGLTRIPEEKRDLLLRKVFDYSRLLGQSLVRHLGLTWELSDFTSVLPDVGIPCFKGTWRPQNQAYVLEREGCSSFICTGRLGCNYWREALDGLVMGLGESERFTRHRSCGHGDGSCLDVLFMEEEPLIYSGKQALGSKEWQGQRFGEIPSQLNAPLLSLAWFFEKEHQVRLHYEGVSENTLFYHMEIPGEILCGSKGKMLEAQFVKKVKQIHPTLAVKDTTPLAVYGGTD